MTFMPDSLAIGIGEVLWDRLPGGDELGGAPLNVVSHLARLGHRAAYLTAVGADPPGDAALARLASRGIDTSLVSRLPGIPTGLAEVSVGPGGSPAFAIRRPAAFEHWYEGEHGHERGHGHAGPRRHDDVRGHRAEHGHGGAASAVAAMRPAFLAFGTLAQLPAAARAALAAIAAGCPDAVTLYDVNLRDGWWAPDTVAALAGLASVLKLSDSEAAELGPLLGAPPDAGPERLCAALARQHGLRGVAVTAGPGPAALWLDGAFARAAPPPVRVTDAVGAGDAFAAGLLDAIGRGLPAAAALRRANALGALVASRRGAQPPWDPAELPD